jgi:long-chain acyl-CoA synthetase
MIMQKQHVSHLIESRAKEYGNRTVFQHFKKGTYDISSISWTDMIEYCRKVSRSLLSLGYGYDDKLGIFSNNRPEWTIADMGIMAMRGVPVPFYSTSSKHEIKYIIDETQMKLLFAGNEEQLEKSLWLLDNCESLERVVMFDYDGELANDACMKWEDFLQLGSDNGFVRKAEEVLDAAREDDLATIIYTSGTTGVPKGAMIDHKNMMAAFRIHNKRIDLNDADLSMSFLPLSHVFERTWILYVLSRGATNHFLENPREVIEALPKVRPTVMCVVPRFFEKTHDGIMLEYSKWPGMKQKIFNWSLKQGYKVSAYKCRNKNVPAMMKTKYGLADKLVLAKLRQIFGGNIRYMPVSGAAIREDLLRFFHATGLFLNYGYGTTETTATVSCFKSDEYNFESCGTVMPELEIKFGEDGEIMIKGDTVFRGYYKKPKETKAALDDGYYKSGDKGHFAENGDLVMTDRIKDLMKTSIGKYVSPQKLELLLGNDRYIEQVIVVGDDRKFVVGLIVPSFEHLLEKAKEFGLEPMSNDTLIANERILEFVQKRVDMLQEELSPHEKVVKFSMLDEPFSIEGNTMTSTLKLRRKNVMEKHKEMIDALYLSA